MGYNGPDVAHGTMFGTHQITVAHEGETVVFNMDNAMNDIATAIDPSQKHIALFYKTSPFQDDPLTGRVTLTPSRTRRMASSNILSSVIITSHSSLLMFHYSLFTIH